MVVPYKTWPFLYRLAWEASDLSNGYDESFYKSLQMVENLRRYRYNDQERGPFFLDGHRFEYRSKLSTDQCAIWTLQGYEKHDILVFAYRGTNFDPVRFLNDIPKDIDTKLRAYIARHNSNRKQMTDISDLPFTGSDFCNCSMDECPISKSSLTRDNALFNVVQGYCDKDTVDKYSDCYSDLVLLSASLGLIESVESKSVKHREAAKHAIEVTKTFLEMAKHPIILFTGHSLGGSIGYYAYLKTIEEVPKTMWPSIHYVGFNPGVLGTFAAFVKTNQTLQSSYQWLRNTIVLRNTFDLVSRPNIDGLDALGPYTQVISYKRNNDKEETSMGRFDTLTHSLWPLKSCEHTITDTRGYEEGQSIAVYGAKPVVAKIV
jgi:hypothetical protein